MISSGYIYLGRIVACYEQYHDPLGPVEYCCGYNCYSTTKVHLVWLVWSKPRPRGLGKDHDSCGIKFDSG